MELVGGKSTFSTPEVAVYDYCCKINNYLFGQTFTKYWTPARRLEWLAELEGLIISAKDDICKTVSTEKGVSPENVLMNEYTPVRTLIKDYKDSAINTLSDEDRSRPLSSIFGAKVVSIGYEPYGVVGVISPFNYPFALPLGPVISAILTGNGVILKPSPDTPNTNALLKGLLKESLARFKAADLFWMLPTDIKYGEALVAYSQVRKIHFTGSVKAGRAIAEANDKVRSIPATLELGGSNAAIVLEDANLDEAVNIIVWSRYCGLSCNSIKRVFVVKERFDEFKKLLSIKVWDISPHERVIKMPEREIKNYSRFLEEYACKYPALIAIAPHEKNECVPVVCFLEKYDSSLAMLKEETFCPILPVVKVDTPYIGVRYANDTRFGLGASIFTKDRQKFLELAAQLDCGIVCQNDALTEFAQPQVPFGGRKDSGWGFTHGPEGLLDFVQKKTIIAEKDNLITSATKAMGLWKIQLYPWTPVKLSFLRRWIDFIINRS